MTASHQSSGPSTGFAMPGLEPAVADAELLLAQVRGTGMGQAVGHEPEDTGGGRLGGAAAGGRCGGRRRASGARARRSAAGGGAARDAACGRPADRRCRPGPPGRRRGPRPDSAPERARSIPCSSTTSVLLAMLSASRSARSASNWRRSISRRTASSGGASDSASSGPPSSTGSSPVMNDSSRLRGLAGIAAGAEDRLGVERRDALDLARVRGGSTASRRRTGRCRGQRRGGAPSTTGSAVPCRSSGRPWAHAT